MAGHLLKRHNCITGSPMLSQIRGTDEEHGGGIHRLPLASARPEPGPTPRGRTRHRRRQQVVSTVADRGRRGHRQDQDTRSSGRASDPEWRRPAPSAAADLHSARRARDDPARPPYPGRSSRRLRVRADGYPALVGNISFGRQPTLKAPRPFDRARPLLHHSRPFRFGGSPRTCAHGARPVPNAFPLPP